MAILNDLAKETSFRRFYLRWLAACWLPALALTLPFAAGAFAYWLKIAPVFKLLFASSGFVLPLFWLLVALGQWQFMRRYSSAYRRWTASVVLAGLLATFVLFFVGGLTFNHTTGILYPLLIAASMATGVFDATPWLLLVGGAGFGFVLSAAFSLLLTSSVRLRALWIAVMAVVGAASFALLWPLCDTMIWTWSMLRFPPRATPLIVFSGVMGAPTGVLLAGWVLWSCIAGVALWYMRPLQARNDLARTKRIFD